MHDEIIAGRAYKQVRYSHLHARESGMGEGACKKGPPAIGSAHVEAYPHGGRVLLNVEPHLPQTNDLLLIIIIFGGVFNWGNYGNPSGNVKIKNNNNHSTVNFFFNAVFGVFLTTRLLQAVYRLTLSALTRQPTACRGQKVSYCP